MAAVTTIRRGRTCLVSLLLCSREVGPMGCCESDEEGQHLINEREAGRRGNIQDSRPKRVIVQDTTPRRPETPQHSSGYLPVVPVISPMQPAQDRTLNSYLAQSIPGSLQEASFIAPTELEEDMERYEAVVNKAMKVRTFWKVISFVQDFIDLSQLNQESMTTFLSVSDKLQLYKEHLDGCLRDDAREPTELIPALLSRNVNVEIGTDSDITLSANSLRLLAASLEDMNVKDLGPLVGTLSDDMEEW